MTAATARAHPNIALVKYWGKRDEALMLPAAGSLSLTLDAYPTTTTVALAPDATEDRFELDGTVASPEQTRRVRGFLDLVRARTGATTRTVVRSWNEAPTDAGLASSAAGFAALAVAASAVYGLHLDRTGLSRLARRGSGSAARSIVPGLALWHAGTDDASSFAEPVRGPAMRMVIVTVDRSTKPISSRAAMRLTALTSPYHDAWVASAARSLEAMVAACAANDFTRIGRIAESNALRMHAVIQSADPPVHYLGSRGLAVFEAVEEIRRSGVEAYATADAGPNVAVLVRPSDADRVADELSSLGGVRQTGAGPGAAIVAEGDDA